MSGSPLVSICIPIYNGEKYIEETLNCVVNQTYSNLEIVISDNCSTDNSIALIKKFNDPRIKIYNNVANQGLAYNFKKVFTYATGKYIAFLGADDLMGLTSVEEAVAILENEKNKNVVLVNTYIEIINDESKHVITKKSLFGEGAISTYWGIRLNLLVGTNIIGEPNGSLFKKEAYDKIPEPKFKNANTWTMDVDLKNELFLIGKGYMIAKSLGKFRISNQSTSKKDLKFTQAKLFREYAMTIYRDKRYNLSFFWIITATINSLILEVARNIFYKLFILNK
jgi:glycosyltransferase involved in cell wall biosynthesis